VKKRIPSAALVVADLSTANPNVYLEVGHAWGCGKPTILTVRQTEDLKFDDAAERTRLPGSESVVCADFDWAG